MIMIIRYVSNLSDLLNNSFSFGKHTHTYIQTHDERRSFIIMHFTTLGDCANESEGGVLARLQSRSRRRGWRLQEHSDTFNIEADTRPLADTNSSLKITSKCTDRPASLPDSMRRSVIFVLVALTTSAMAGRRQYFTPNMYPVGQTI